MDAGAAVAVGALEKKVGDLQSAMVQPALKPPDDLKAHSSENERVCAGLEEKSHQSPSHKKENRPAAEGGGVNDGRSRRKSRTKH